MFERLSKFIFPALALPLLLIVIPAANAQSPTATAPPEKSTDLMRQMSASFESLVKRVSPAVVEVQVTGFGSTDEDEDSDNDSKSSSIGRQRSLGSGVIVDPDGYIITNYHVVKGAERVRVILTPQSNGSQPTSSLKSRGKVLPARIVGFSKLIDLAVLKIEATGLPTLQIGRYEKIQKGQLVLAFGSPEGLENSVSMGLVSSVLRQTDADDSMVYIQTDAAINPGNSGGPLVDADGNVVGIDTFIYTKSGGNEGIGFAIPSGIVRYAYEQIRKYGRVRRRSIGADVQSLTPDLAQALGLSADVGVLVSDVYSEGSAAQAGLKIEDVIVALDGFPVDNVPLFTLGLYLVNQTDTAKITVLRAGKKIDMVLPIYEPRDAARLSELGDPTKDVIPRLGIVGATITPEVAEIIGDLRISSGVLVTSIVADRLAVDSGLSTGDVIHSLNRKSTKTVDELRNAFTALKPGEPAAMQVERNGKLTYVTFEME
ncbi:MAG TPA: trypsin-like peptidase domain-containing protein [Candidatus Acidoferrum sp.]|nr:trypsin-like peptidase domain-containing protein [Candidatus Acidoferrum sp.]